MKLRFAAVEAVRLCAVVAAAKDETLPAGAMSTNVTTHRRNVFLRAGNVPRNPPR
jgi:hypothetical protein